MAQPLKYGSDLQGMRVDIWRACDSLEQVAAEVRSMGQHLFSDNQASEIEAAVLEIREAIRAKSYRKYTGRVAPVRRGLPKNWQVTKAQLMAKRWPMLQQQDIATRCDLSAGRVSEILSGLIYIDPTTGDVKRKTR